MKTKDCYLRFLSWSEPGKRYVHAGFLGFRILILSLISATFLAPQVCGALSWREQVEADWLRQDLKRFPPPAISPSSDAAGAVDGFKTRKWGFHTAFEKTPWWQVDLQRETAIEKCLVFNRGDGFAERSSHLILSISSNGLDFQTVYQHDGSVFRVGNEEQPLEVKLGGVRARFVRLSVPGESYLHLDEVEVYAVGSSSNVARQKPALQSSVSQWSEAHFGKAQTRTAYATSTVLARGFKLADSQSRLGADVSVQVQKLEQLRTKLAELSGSVDESALREVYLHSRWAVRELALANPLLSFDRLLFTKRAPSMFPHMSDQYYGWWSRPGGGLFLLENFKKGEPVVRSLTGSLPQGSFLSADLSWDAKKVLFAASKFYPTLANEQNKADKSRVPENAFYHVYEVDIDGSNLHRVSQGKYDDFDPRYLPDGGVLFLSTRKGTAIQCTQWYSDATRHSDQPDSYVRCGGDNYRPVPVFTLHAMDSTGANIRPLSAFENFEWSPSVANDGRILYTRWDYIDRFNGHFFSLWSANQDGSNPQLVYGNYTVKPQVKFEARSIPNSTKLVFTAAAHHSNAGGTLCILDRDRGTEGDAPITQITPDARYPETEANDDHYYASPWPLSEEFFLVGWADAKLPPHGRYEDAQNPVNAMGLYLLDVHGNLELLYRDPEISSVYPIPVAARPRPPVHSSVAQSLTRQEADVLLQDVYNGLDGVPRGSVKQLRIVGVVPKVQPHMNNPVLGVSAEDPGKFVLGTVPVESDGSAFFRVPSGVPVFFQALDATGAAVQTMRTLTYAMPGQALACVGCHEHRESAPRVSQPSLAVARAASKIAPGPEGSWPLSFDRLVQPVLDRYCIECHRAGSEKLAAEKLPLTPDRAYLSLISFSDENVKKQAFERDRSIPNQAVAASTKLWRMFNSTASHQDLKLDPDSLSRFATWLDTYAQRQGHFSEQQERDLADFREALNEWRLK